ncbi:adenylyltransferase and sulfurtransferase MOCS3-like [Ptychodera flava]|uniref:adenylyltransferase and sulfurtransferase MOCS3-like n=1 Tax=Ptychodera flava TaxID=63121 RepID=UPI003969DF4F
MAAPHDSTCECERLRLQLSSKIRELEDLRGKLRLLEENKKAETSKVGKKASEEEDSFEIIDDSHLQNFPKLSAIEKLDNSSIARHSRQLILPEIGVKGQVALANTSVLIVGAGGLGCPSAVYLAAAGVGCLGFIDYDDVELSNLHRQVLHTEDRIGVPKSASATTAIKGLNSSVLCVPYHLALNSSNALSIISRFDIVLDCSDNVATRYLLNDACVLTGKPLVSGSALRFEGQLTVYNYKDGPCYRCLYPTPPPPETVTNCSDGGVLGVVPGIIGCMQALEAIKIATGIGPSYCQKLLMFDGIDGTFRTIKLRSKKSTCVVCGHNPTITELIDYEQFCGASATDKTKSLLLLKTSERISVKDYAEIRHERVPHILVDVRQPCELDIGALPNTTNIPISDIEKDKELHKLRKEIAELSRGCEMNKGDEFPVYVVCRLGNDSQKAVKILQDKLSVSDVPVTVKDIQGGLMAWAKKIDPEFPQY